MTSDFRFCTPRAMLLIGLLIIAGCSEQQSQTQPPLSAANLPAWEAAQLPPLPDSRSASAVFVDTLEGAAAFQQSANASTEDTDLVLSSGSNSVSWGIWEFTPELRYLDHVEVILSVPEGQEAYIALADYSLNAWQLDGPLTIGKQLQLDDDRHKTPEGRCYIAVIVAGGNTATVDRLILATDDGWTISRAAYNASAADMSAAIVDGNPAIAYYTNGVALRYARANDALGQTWSPYKTPDSDGDVGDFCSLQVVNGNPAVSYYDRDEGDQLFIRAEDSTGSSWGDPVIAAFGGDSGKFNSMTVADGLPIIAHYNANGTYLACARAEDANGESWATAQVVDNIGNTGRHASMTIVNGVPAVSYQSDGFLRYSYAGNAAGTSWPNDLYIDDTEDVGAFSSLAVINGAPAVAYLDFNERDLLYLRAADAQGDSWGSPVVIDGDDGDDVGTYCSLAEIGGVPAIAYYRFTDKALYYVQARDADGTAWYTPVVVDGEDDTGHYCCLLEIGGQPAIAYYSLTEADIMFAIRQQP